jgi:hypothetical protein
MVFLPDKIIIPQFPVARQVNSGKASWSKRTWASTGKFAMGLRLEFPGLRRLLASETEGRSANKVRYWKLEDQLTYKGRDLQPRG